jgi:mono/diheme cytochrome c family protein
MKRRLAAAALLAGLALAGSAWAEAPTDFLKSFEADARKADPAFKGFSAQRGAQFFKSQHGGEWSCASCHTENPAGNGKHAKTDKKIDPLAPSVNAERFTNPAKVEKWFRRNCNDTLDRQCSPQEKGDVLAYLMTVK